MANHSKTRRFKNIPEGLTNTQSDRPYSNRMAKSNIYSEYANVIEKKGFVWQLQEKDLKIN